MIAKHLVIDAPVDLTSYQMPMALPTVSRHELQQGLREIIPEVLSSDFDSMRLTSPSRHRSLTDSATTLALVALGHKPLACLPDSFLQHRHTIVEHFKVFSLDVPFPLGRDERERFHVFNPEAVYNLINQHSGLSYLKGLSLEEAVREVMTAPRRTGAVGGVYHRSLGLLYGYPLEATEHFTADEERHKGVPPTRNTLGRLLSEDAANGTFSYLFDERVSFAERQQCLEGIIPANERKGPIISRYASEVSQRSFGIGRFIWRDLKDSSSSIQKVTEMTMDLASLQLPYYLADGPMGSFRFVNSRHR